LNVFRYAFGGECEADDVSLRIVRSAASTLSIVSGDFRVNLLRHGVAGKDFTAIFVTTVRVLIAS
jgi:hypothetical protein